MKLLLHLTYCFATILFFTFLLGSGGCAQIGLPTGGVKDTLAPKLVKATPLNGSVNVKDNKITLLFNEYIDVQEVQQNLIVSPVQNKNPTITSNPKSITIKFKDTLLPNTTYTVNFGNAIKDINEGNVYKNLSYTFSTGDKLDSLTIAGKVILAETGNIDSTLIVMLYRNAVDTTVTKKKPNYIAKVNGDGSFEFNNLPAASFKIYALKDGDGGKTYNSTSEIFAFTDADINATNPTDITLYAYAEKKIDANTDVVKPKIKAQAEKKLKVTNNLQNAKQDLLQALEINFNNPLKFIDSTKIYLTDTFFKKLIAVTFLRDSTSKKIILNTKWQPDMPLILMIDTAAVKDSANNKLAKNDTIRFTTKRLEDYGKLTLRFNGLDEKKNNVLQFLIGDEVKYSFPIVGKEWSSTMFVPGDYGIRILYDTNNDGEWTPGNYIKKRQPETAITLPQKLNVKADWENEREINL